MKSSIVLIHLGAGFVGGAQTRQLTLENFREYISKYDRTGQCLNIFDNMLITKGIDVIPGY
jgi:hypothetical protein